MVENRPFEEQLEALDNQRDKANKLLNAIDNLKEDLKKKHSHKMMRDWQSQIEQQLGITLSYDKHSFGIQLNNKVWLGVWDGYDSQSHLPYWGFLFDSFKKDNMPELYAQIKTLLNNAEIYHFTTEKGWVAWCNTQKGIERFTSLYRSAKEIGLL